MKNILLILFLFVGNGDKITKITKANEAKKLAEEAFEAKKYDEAIKNYTYLLDSLNYEDPKAQLNLAHAYYLSDDSTNSIQTYNSLLTSTDKSIKSIAHQQLGAISEKNNDLKTALNHFKNALKANPSNKEARYNYELVKKKLEQQKEENKDKKEDKKQDQKKEDEKKEDKKDEKEEKKEGDKKDKEGDKDQKKEEGDKGEKEKDQEKKDEKGEGEKSEEQKKKEKEEKEKGKDGEPKKKEEEKKDKSEELTPEEKKAEEEKANKQAQQQRFDEMKMSPEKAKMILNAMKQGEKQYIQQLQKKGTKQKDSDKPDW